MKINVDASDPTSLIKALAEVNGKAKTHTFCHWELSGRCNALETRLEEAGIAKSDRRGCTATLISGYKLPNSFKYPVIRTKATVERFASGWFVTNLERLENHHNQGVGQDPEIQITVAARTSMLKNAGFIAI